MKEAAASKFRRENIISTNLIWKMLNYKPVLIQAAFINCGFALFGLDYSRTRKQGKTVNNMEKTWFFLVLVFRELQTSL